MEDSSTAEQVPIVVEVWADLGCPWCYLGKHRLQRAIEARPDAGRFQFDLDRKNANTSDLHRVTHFAERSGHGFEFFSQLQDRFFSGEIDPYDADAMVEVAQSLGLDGDRVREVLANDEFADDVRADASEGMALGAQGVPFTVFGRRIAAAGAQSVAAYGQALDHVLQAEVTASVRAPAPSG